MDRALASVPVDDYNSVGLVLGVGLNQIKVFETNYNRDVQRVWKEIMQHWLNSSSSNTWFTLAEKLLDGGYSRYAERFAIIE